MRPTGAPRLLSRPFLHRSRAEQSGKSPRAALGHGTEGTHVCAVTQPARAASGGEPHDTQSSLLDITMIMGDVSKEVVSACVCALPLAVRSAMHRRDTIRVAGGFGLPNSWRVAAARCCRRTRAADVPVHARIRDGWPQQPVWPRRTRRTASRPISTGPTRAPGLSAPRLSTTPWSRP